MSMTKPFSVTCSNVLFHDIENNNEISDLAMTFNATKRTLSKGKFHMESTYCTFLYGILILFTFFNT